MKNLTLFAGVLALLLLLVSGPLFQMDVINLTYAFYGLRGAVILGGIALVLALIQVIFMRKTISWPITGIAVICAAVAVIMPVSQMMKAKSVPPIHDITTDLVNPPKFVAILALRADAPNPAEYQGEEIAKQQRQAYPEIKTQGYKQTTEQVFDAALAAVKDMGLEVVNSDKTLGLIEAYDTTTWFGFVDDVVIRIQSADQITLMDARSKSRLGRSDVGKNAERLNDLIARVKSNLN